MEDKTLTCSDCSQEFTFRASEQEFFAQKGFSTPGRCPICRAARKVSRQGSSSYGTYGNSGSSYRGSGGYGGTRQMYPAVCAQCGRDTEVPFKPSGNRPVYCPDCYRQQNPGRSSGGGSRGYRRDSRW